MAVTPWPRSYYVGQRVDEVEAHHPSEWDEWVLFAEWRFRLYATSGRPWSMAAVVDVESDPGTVASWSLVASVGGATALATFEGRSNGVRLGWEPITPVDGAELSLWLTGRRFAGDGGIRLLHSAAVIVSVPPTQDTGPDFIVPPTTVVPIPLYPSRYDDQPYAAS